MILSMLYMKNGRNDERQEDRKTGRKKGRKKKKEERKMGRQNSQFHPHSVSTAYFTSAKAVRGFATGTN